MNRHRSGCFKARRASVAVPLIVARTKSERVAKGNRTRAANQRAKVLRVAAMLRADKVFADWMGVFL